MYDIVFKMIEAGLLKDSGSVRRYGEILEKEMLKDGNSEEASKVHSILQKRHASRIVADSISSMPIDTDSNLSILDIESSPASPDLILHDSIRSRVDDFIEAVENRECLSSAGLPLNMSLLLYGPPGCGKTSIARHIAGKLGLPLATVRLDGIISAKLGSTAKNIRKIFEYAENHECVLFLDELDAVAKTRDDGYELGELKRVVNSLLLNMDEYCRKGILIAATNHDELLDGAIWRRFQTIMEIEKPGAKEIGDYCFSLMGELDISLFRGKDRDRITNAMTGLSYADVNTIMQNVIRHMVIQNRRSVVPLEIIGELINFKHHSNLDRDVAIREMLELGYSQRSVASYLNISTRQVRNCVQEGA